DVVRLAARARRVASLARPATGLKLSLCMIVKDEEEMLPGCLEPIRHHVDEIIVVDTGSTDRTVEIAESFGAKVIHFPWNGSFSDARNVGLDAASGDWLMYLDADARARQQFETAWTQLGSRWQEVGYGSILIARLGAVRRVDGDLEGARAVLAQGLAVFADHTDLVYELSLCAWETGDLAEAERLARRCLEIGHA